MRENLKEFALVFVVLLSVMAALYNTVDLREDSVKIGPETDQQGRLPGDEHYEHEHRFGQPC